MLYLQNESSDTVEIEVRVSAVRITTRKENETGRVYSDANYETLSSRTYELAPDERTSTPWLGGQAETYRIDASVVGTDWEQATTFSPSDWGKRNTPVVRVLQDGVVVSV